MQLVRSVYELLPPGAKESLKQALATNGHRRSILDSFKAREHATGKKRLDRIAMEVAAKLSLAGIDTLENRTVLEVGAGYCPSECLVYDLLGAKRIFAIDMNPILSFPALRRALLASDGQAVVQALERYLPGQHIARRFAEWRCLGYRDFVHHLEQRIAYLAPYRVEHLAGLGGIDIVSSTSVLEHIPDKMLPTVLSGLEAGLNPGGTAIHHIDLKDHRDRKRASLDFLAVTSDYKAGVDVDARGNRLRKSDWMSLFSKATRESRCVFEKAVPSSHVPKNLLPEFRNRSLQDLVVGEVIVVAGR